MCNIAYARARAELREALLMADGKERKRALERFDDDLYAPLEGASETDVGMLLMLAS